MSRQHGIFGIDLGSTYSVIAYIDETGRPVVARNSYGDNTTPSVVFFENETDIVVGKAAREAAGMFRDQVVAHIKRNMGDRDYSLTFFGKDYTPPSISALILGALAKQAAEATQRAVGEVVITVPAYFGLLEKDATKKAGEIAGLQVIGIVPEPVAVALHYGVTGTADGTTFLVYDLGGGTFDISLLRMTEDTIEVLAVGGEHMLGGTEWDMKLFDYIVEQTIEQTGDDSILDDEAVLQELRLVAESTKQALSRVESTTITRRHSGTVVKIVVTRGQFEELTADLLEATIRITKRTLAEAEQRYPGAGSKISALLLAGGSSWMPAVAERLKQEFPWEPTLADPDLAVAKGAALYAAGQKVAHMEVARDSMPTLAPGPATAEEVPMLAGRTGLDIFEAAVASSALVPFVQALAAKAADDVYSSLRLRFRKQPRRPKPEQVSVADEYAKLVLQLPPMLDSEMQESLHRLLAALTSFSEGPEARWLHISQASGSTSGWNVGMLDEIPDNCIVLPAAAGPDGHERRFGDQGNDQREQQERLSNLEQERKLLRKMVKYLAAEIDPAE